MSWHYNILSGLKKKYIENKDYVTIFGKMVEDYLQEKGIEKRRKMDKTFLVHLSMNMSKDVHVDETMIQSSAYNQHYYEEWYFKIFRDLLKAFKSDFPISEVETEKGYLDLQEKAINAYLIDLILEQKIPDIPRMDKDNEGMIASYREKYSHLSGLLELDKINPNSSEWKFFSKYYFQKELLHIMVEMGIMTSEDILKDYFKNDGYDIKYKFQEIFSEKIQHGILNKPETDDEKFEREKLVKQILKAYESKKNYEKEGTKEEDKYISMLFIIAYFADKCNDEKYINIYNELFGEKEFRLQLIMNGYKKIDEE